MAGRGLAAHSKKVAAWQAHLVLIDETGFFLNPLVRRTLAPRGQTPVLQTWGRHRDKVSVIAGLSVSPVRRRVGLYFRTDPDSYITAEAAADFLRDLLRHIRGRVVVVWDNGANHKGPAVRALLRRTRRLHLEALPPYAPDLNPVEAVWSYVKHGRLPNFVPKSLAHLDDTVLEELSDAKVDSQLLRALWHGSDLPFPLPSLPDGQ